MEEDSKPKLFLASLKGKYSLFVDEKEQPEQSLAPVEDSHEVKTANTKKVAVHEEELQVKQKSPITILSDDEGYLLEEKHLEKTTVETETYREIPTSGSKAAKPNRKRSKLEVVELTAIQHQRKELKMPEEIASYWRPKTRSKNKLRLNMKKLLNPRLNTNEVTVLDDVSMDDKPELDKVSRKVKKQIVAKASYVHPAKAKSSLKSLGDSSQPIPKISEIYFEIRSDI